MNSDSRDNIPKLIVDVNLGKNDMFHIIVYEGDSPRILAREFAYSNNLD